MNISLWSLIIQPTPVLLSSLKIAASTLHLIQPSFGLDHLRIVVVELSVTVPGIYHVVSLCKSFLGDYCCNEMHELN